MMDGMNPHKRALILGARSTESEDKWINDNKPNKYELDRYRIRAEKILSVIERFEYIDGSFVGAILEIMSDGSLRIDDRATDEPLSLMPEEFEAACKWYLGISEGYKTERMSK